MFSTNGSSGARRIPSTILAAGAIALLGGVPLAIAAGPLSGGSRNPSDDQSQAFGSETEIIANNGTYGTRQSNKSGTGGGAIYGCRSRAGGSAKGFRPCIRANNLTDGYAFEFQSNTGAVVGRITTSRGGDSSKPFTTNATGVADGLNADRVDGRNATDFLAATAKALDADKLDGRDSTSFASVGDLLFAAVGPTGTLAAKRFASAASYDVTGNRFTVTFDRDVSACSYTATENAASASGTSFAVQSAGATAPRAVIVDETGITPVAFHLQVVC